jgi:rubrerythrin
MRYDFTADEIFDMAEKMEQNGYAFYRKAAESVSEPEARKLLLELAEMEVEHEKTFASLRSGLSASMSQPTVFDPEGESAMYLRALVDTKVFFDKKVDTTSMREILKEALVAEKDSIVFYLGMKEAVPEKLGKERIDAIIKEEMGHIRSLSRELVARK